MAVEHIFLSINEILPIRNLPLCSIVAVDNYQLAQIIEVKMIIVMSKERIWAVTIASQTGTIATN